MEALLLAKKLKTDETLKCEEQFYVLQSTGKFNAENVTL